MLFSNGIRRTASGVFGCLFFAFGTAFTQTDITRISIEDLANTEVFSASRYLQKTIDAPASITIVTADEIRQFGFRTLADVVSNARGFYSSNDRNYTYIGVRGFARPGDYNSRLLLLVDGHRINDPVYDQGEFDRTLPLDLDLIERVEIVRGPTSSLYGTSAMLAVVNVITRKGAALNGVQVSSEVGALGAYAGRVSFGRQLKHGIDLLASVSALNTNGDQTVFFPEFNAPATNFGVAESLDGERARSAYLSVGGHGITLRGAYGQRFKLVPTASFGNLFNRRESTIDRTGYVDFSADRKFEKWDLHAHTSYNSYTYNGVYQLDYGDPYLDYARAKWWTADAFVSPHIGHRQNVQFGGEIRVATRRSQYSNVNDVGFGSTAGPFTWSLFVQDEVTIIPQLKIAAGLRYDDLGSAQKRASPRFALVFKPRKSTALKFLVSSAFRAPNAFEQAYWPAQVNLPALHPEKIQSFEIIAEHYFAEDLRLSFSIYRNSIDDLISQTADAAGNIGYINAGDVDSNGLGIEVEKRFRSGWYLRGSWSAQRSFDPATRLVISNSPVHLAKAAVVIPLFHNRVELGITDRMASGVENVRGNSVAGQNLTDVTISSTKLWQKSELSASVYNLFNSRVSIPGAEEHVQGSIPQAGRTWRVKLTHTF
jgi:iron complex outermembrane receptor protein